MWWTARLRAIIIARQFTHGAPQAVLVGDAQLGRWGGLVHFEVGGRGEVLLMHLWSTLLMLLLVRLLFDFAVLQLKEKSIARFKIRSWGCVAIDGHYEGLLAAYPGSLLVLRGRSGRRELAGLAAAGLVLQIVQWLLRVLVEGAIRLETVLVRLDKMPVAKMLCIKTTAKLLILKNIRIEISATVWLRCQVVIVIPVLHLLLLSLLTTI